MTLDLDEITFKRLVLAKKIFSRGVSQLESAQNFADKIIGLISLDLANETTLKAVIASRPLKRNEKGFDCLITKVNEFLKDNHLEKIPDEANIKKVHKLRNDAQHDAECPNDNSLSDCRTYTTDFLSKIILNVWGIDFVTLSLISLVNASHLKLLLEKATASLERADFTNACFDAVAAFDRLMGATRFAVVGSDNYVHYPGTERAGNDAINSLEKAIDREETSDKKDKLRDAKSQVREALGNASRGEWPYAEGAAKRALKLIEEVK